MVTEHKLPIEWDEMAGQRTEMQTTALTDVSSRHHCIQTHKGILGCGIDYTAAIDEKGRVHYTGTNRWRQVEAAQWTHVIYLACGPEYVLGLTQEGYVRMAGRDGSDGTMSSAVSSLVCVRALACGPTHAAALLENGHVRCIGGGTDACTHTDAWTGILDVCCGLTYTLGLTAQGRVQVAGGSRAFQRRVQAWKNVAGLFSSVDGRDAYAITENGRLLSTRRMPRKTRAWRDLVYLSAAGRGLWAVTASGELLSLRAPVDEFSQEAMRQSAGQIVLCAAGPAHAVVVGKDGRPLALGEATVHGRVMHRPLRGMNRFGRSDVGAWGRLFERFEPFSVARNQHLQTLRSLERQYQIRSTLSERGVRHLACGPRLTACLTASDHVLATGGLVQTRAWSQVVALACGATHLLGLTSEGRVLATGNRESGACEVEDWSHICAIVAGRNHSLGLEESGRVRFAGLNHAGQGDVTSWEHITMLRGTDTCTVGVDSAGTFHVAGHLPVDEAALACFRGQSIADVCITEHLIAALCADGRVLAVGDAHTHLEETATWSQIRQLAAGDAFLAGLRYGGTVVATGANDAGQCEVQTWRQVVSIACGATHMVGLRVDGTVLSAGVQRTDTDLQVQYEPLGSTDTTWSHPLRVTYAPCDTSTWSEVLAVCCGRDHTVALTMRGKLLACGMDIDGQCSETNAFTLFRHLQQLDGYGRYNS